MRDTPSKWRLVFSEIATLTMTIGMAFLVWLVAVREENPLITNIYTQEIPLRVVQPPEGLVISNPQALPDAVRVRIRAPQSSWQTLLPSKFVMSADLSTYGPGTHVVPIEGEIFDPGITILEVIPPQIRLELNPLIRRNMPVTVRMTDELPLGYFNRPPNSNPLTVTLVGPERAVNEVDQVVAEVSVLGQRETLVQTVDLSVRNPADDTVDNVTLNPREAEVTIPIEQRFGFKDVSVKAVVTGQPAAGYWISSISVQPAALSLRGLPVILEDITGLVETVDVDISNATETLEQRVPLDLPPGVSVVTGDESVSNNPSVLVTVGIAALTGGQTVQRSLQVQGLNDNFTWETAPETVELILFGPLPVLQNLNEDDLRVTLDLFDLDVGVHRVVPTVAAPDGVEITSMIPESVEVTIAARDLRPTPTPVATVTPDLTTTPTLTATPVLTAPTGRSDP